MWSLELWPIQRNIFVASTAEIAALSFDFHSATKHAPWQVCDPPRDVSSCVKSCRQEQTLKNSPSKFTGLITYGMTANFLRSSTFWMWAQSTRRRSIHGARQSNVITSRIRDQTSTDGDVRTDHGHWYPCAGFWRQRCRRRDRNDEVPHDDMFRDNIKSFVRTSCERIDRTFDKLKQLYTIAALEVKRRLPNIT